MKILRGLREEKMKSIRSFAQFSETAQPDLHSERYRLVSTLVLGNGAHDNS